MTENLCPLVTPYTEAIGAPLKTMELLARVRAHDPEEGPIPITLPDTWRKTAKTSGKPLALRNFQTQMVAHLIKMPRFLNGDGVGLGKTASSIAAATFLKAKNPNLKILVFGTKSTTYQWKDEGFDEFTTLNTHVMEDSYKKLKGHEARIAQLKDFLEGEWDVLICKYTSFIGRRRTLEGDFDEHGHPIAPGQKEDLSQETRDLIETITPYGDDVILICDECHKFKSTTAQVRNMVMALSKRIGRVWGMTATAIQNSLEDFYSIASAIGIRPFGGMMPFREKFCRYKMTYIGRGRQKPTLVGYKDVKEFKIGMRPFFYGRSQAQVKEKLPQLTTRYIPIDLNDQQIKLLDDIQKGKASLPPTIKKINGEFFQKERDITNKMTLMGIMQQISNHPCLLEDTPQSLFTKTLSAKEEELKELLDGELLGEKVLVFAQPLTAKVMTPTGWKSMGELKVGDRLVDPDGGEAKVEAIFPQGKRSTYRVTMKSGATTEVTGDHLWLMQTKADMRNRNGWRVRTTEQMRERLTWGEGTSKVYTAFLPVTQPVVTDEKNLPLSPYILGVLLGDGAVSGGGVSFTSADLDLVERVRKELPEGAWLTQYGPYAYGVTALCGRDKTKEGWNQPNTNPVTSALRALGVHGKKSYEKSIPEIYKCASLQDRLALLQGLMDTDGCCTLKGYTNFRVTSHQLALDVVDLVRSLGGIATAPKPHSSSFNGKSHRVSWATSLRLPMNPFYINRKAARWKSCSLLNPIKSIELTGREVECQCIRVSSKRNLYITDDYIVTHNTKSKKWIDRFEYLFEHGFSDRKFLRITGDEDEAERARNKKLFQTSDEHSIMFINAAIMEGANLQQSANMILLDAPWGWGALIQLVGRMVRMGSPHSHNTLFVMVAKGMIDEYVIDTLKSKKGVFEKILGESHSSGLLDAGGDLDLASGMESLNDDKEFRELLTAHIKNTKILDYLKGDLLAEAQDAGEDYVMSFEKKAKPGIKPKKFEFSDKW